MSRKFRAGRLAGHTHANELPTEVATRLSRLDRLRYVPDGVLTDLVAARGLADRHPTVAEPGSGGPLTDRELAAQLCAGCPVQDECLELDLRWMADRTVGVFAGLTETDRRAAYPLWLEARSHSARPDMAAGDGVTAAGSAGGTR
jgi:WhiB family transcriptional regulator, redox-sensing transcriptional regulator